MSTWRRRSLRAALLVGVLGVVAVAAFELWRRREREYVSGEREEGVVDSLGRRLPGAPPDLRFTDVTQVVGLRMEHFPAPRTGVLPEDMGSGVALGDFDNDGWTDVFLVNIAGPLGSDPAASGAAGRCRLYRNREGAAFDDVSASAGVELGVLGQGALFADCDSDGDLDLLVTSFTRIHLFENVGGGRFEDASERTGMSAFEGFWTGLAAGDADRDGQIELYVCGYVQYHGAEPGAGRSSSQFGVEIDAAINPSSFESERNLYLVRDASGRYVDRARELGLDNPGGRSLGVLFCDLTLDGWPDLYVANDVSDNAFFVNRGDGTFEDATAAARLGDYRGAMGLATSDFDRDGDLDLFVTHWVAQENALYQNDSRNSDSHDNDAQRDDSRDNSHDRRDGDQRWLYLDVADRYGLGQASLDRVGWATRWVDFDGDRQLDLFVVNGSTIPAPHDKTRLTPQRSQLFWNSGGPRGYYEIGELCSAFFGEAHVGRGGATFDYDLDGDDDLLVTLHQEAPRLLRNDSVGGVGWIRLRLRQSEGNRFALGTQVRVHVQGQSYSELSDTQGSYLSQHAVGEVAFALGDAPWVERVDVVWPNGERESAGPFLPDSLIAWTRGAAPQVALLPGARRAQRQPQSVDSRRTFYEQLSGATRARVASEHERAALLYLAALTQWPSHEDALYNLGNALASSGERKGAIAAYRRLVEHHPRSSRGWMQVGLELARDAEHSRDALLEARAAFERCLALNPEESLPATRVGIVQLLLGEHAQAGARLRSALQLNPGSVEALYFDGLLAWIEGRDSDARAQLDAAHAAARKPNAAGPQGMTSEGDTRTGAALLERVESNSAWIDRWRNLVQRSANPQLEYGPWSSR